MGRTIRRMRRGRAALWILFVLFSGTAVALALHYRADKRAEDEGSFQAAEALAIRAAAEIDDTFREARSLADALVRDLGSGALEYGAIEERMRREIAARDNLDGIAISFEPHVYRPDQRLHQEYVHRTPQGSVDILRGATYDYTSPPSEREGAPKTAWYHGPLTRGPMWNEPFLATGASRVLVEFGAPFPRRDGQPGHGGVVTVDFTLESVQRMIARLDLGDTGYGAVFTSRGTFLAHPDRAQLVRGSIFQDRLLEDPDVRAAVEKVRGGTGQAGACVDPVTGLDVWVLFEPIPTTGWSLALVVQRSHGTGSARLRAAAPIWLLGAAAVVTLIALVAGLERWTTRALWVTSSAFSIACTLLIVLTWMEAWSAPPALGTAVASRSAVARYLDRHRQAMTRNEEVHAVPTGLEITALRFDEANTVTAGGFLWMTFPDAVPAGFARRFVFPQQVGDEATVEEVERCRKGEGETVIWRFVTTFQQTYDPGMFPFDQRNVAIRILAAELEGGVVLVPDLEAYPVIAPRALPGVSREIRVPNWTLRESFYTYRMVSPTSNVGVPSLTGRTELPVLQFNVSIRRHYLGAFIAYLLPALLAAGLTFAFLLTRGGSDGNGDLLGGLGYVAAIFFTIVILHSAMRENIAAVGITYLEHVFILMYVVIGLVVIDAFLVAHRREWWFVLFRNHLSAKLVFWPTITAALLASTLAVFAYSA